MLFEPYAEDLARRAGRDAPRRLLEVACGTGIATQAIRRALPGTSEVVATDLNEAMFTHARRKLSGTTGISWRQADATALPFDASSFDMVVCQFGLMFVPDKPAAAREARRVLGKGGRVIMSVWDTLEHNPLGRIPHATIASFFPGNPPDFYQVPFGYADPATLRALLRDAGFEDITLESLTLEAVSLSARHAAFGLVHGNPVVAAIRERGVLDTQPIVDALAMALERAGGNAPFRVPMQAFILSGRVA
jgi:ubiquinone/menaquinone biosynthesis C-methylase UbiE